MPLEIHHPINRLIRRHDDIKRQVVLIIFLCLLSQSLRTLHDGVEQLSTIRLLIICLQDEKLQRLIHADSVACISSGPLHIPIVNSKESKNLVISKQIARLIAKITQVFQLTQVRNKNPYLANRRSVVNHDLSITEPPTAKAIGGSINPSGVQARRPDNAIIADEARTGTIHTIAAAVLLDGDGKLADVMLDELEVEVTADGKGVVTMPTDYRTKRQKGGDYPLAAASSLKKGWAEQADDFADYLTGMTPEQASMLETDKDGKATDADLLSGCTIRVDQYRDAVAKACTNASALGAAKGDRVSLGVEAENASSDITATDDKDVNAEVDLTVVALTLDADGRVTSAIGDMAEPALTIAADGGVTAPDTVRSKLELGDSYGMRNASSLGKEWYEHSEGYCSYLKGKTEKEVADIPADGSDADLAALCTISIDALQKAAGDAFENASL